MHEERNERVPTQKLIEKNESVLGTPKVVSVVYRKVINRYTYSFLTIT